MSMVIALLRLPQALLSFSHEIIWTLLSSLIWAHHSTCLGVGAISANTELIFWASPTHPDCLIVCHERLRCGPSSLSRCYPRFLTTILVKLSHLSACLLIGCKYGRPCHYNKSRLSFKGAARCSANPMVGSNLTPYCFDMHGSLSGHHHYLRQADCRILESSTDSTACCVVIGFEFCTHRRVFNQCCHYLVAKRLAWYNISSSALYLEPWSGT